MTEKNEMPHARVDGLSTIAEQSELPRHATGLCESLRKDTSLRQSNLDSYGSDPITDAALDAADRFHSRWRAVPCSDGSVQIEIHSHGWDIEIYVDADGTVSDVYSKQVVKHTVMTDSERPRADTSDVSSGVHADTSHIKSGASPPPDARGWQPIETVSKEPGLEVLLWWPQFHDKPVVGNYIHDSRA